MPSEKWRKENAEKLRKYRRDWYHRNREQRRTKENLNSSNRRKALRAFIISQKTKCLRCPEDHPACLDFHHRDPSTKEFTVCELTDYSLETVKAEIAKCDVLCSNCHRKLHWEEKLARPVGFAPT